MFGVRAVAADAVDVEDADAEDEVGERLRRRGASMRISTRSPEWNTWAGWPSSPTSSTPVISASREPQRPSVAWNMSGGARPAGLAAAALVRGWGLGAGASSCRLPPFAATLDGRLRLGVRLGHVAFFLLLDVRDVGRRRRGAGRPGARAALVEPQRLVAEPLDQVQRVRDEQDRLAAPAELGELVEALVRERLVADRQHFVDQQHVGIDVDRHGEPEAHVHAGRVGLHRRVDEVLELGELDDLVEAPRDLASS